MTFEEWFSNLNDDEPVALKDLLETCWHDAVIEGRNIQIFKDDAERANEFDPDWDETLELVEEIKRLAIENERLRHGEIKYEDWEFNPMTGESLWGKQPVSQEPFGYVNADEVMQHFASVNCGTIYKHQGENRVALYAAVLAEREACAKLLLDDAWALTFQTFGQYRTALAAAIRARGK